MWNVSILNFAWKKTLFSALKGNNSCIILESKLEIYKWFIHYSNMTSFFRFVNKRASYPFGIISLAHAPVNVTDFSIGSINCVRHFQQT